MSKYQSMDEPWIPDRTKIPLDEPTYKPISTRTILTKNNLDEAPKAPPRFTPKAPEGAPNVLVILIDDMGFGASSAFGGPIPMPTTDRLSESGIRFGRFHTTALCAPTRAALLSGYNHHSVNMGLITEAGTAYPGNLSTRPKSVTPVARVLKENGYSTAHFGKCHEVPVWETSAVGPFDHWPTFSGFEKFYGFIGAETNQYHPELYDGITPIKLPENKNYHLTEDLAEKCIEWTNMQRELAPEKPFFIYFAPGATHAPHQAPEEYRDMFKGKFDEGWDVMRETTLENMKKLGIVPEDTKIADKPDAIKDWDKLSDKEKKLFARQMEIYAGYARHTDDQVAKLIDNLEKQGILDNTVVFYILGDNGASAEGNMNGVTNELTTLNFMEEDIDYILEHIDELGTEYANNHYSAGWAVALDSPFKWTKIIASNFGGTRNGMIVHYPDKYQKPGLRNHFSHCIDLAPTILDLCNIPIPKYVDGIEQRPMEGVSLVPVLEDENTKEVRETQYFNIFANNGIYHDGWFAGIVMAEPWDTANDHPNFTKWELYNIEEDFSLSNDLADSHPEKLAEMIELFYNEAEKHNVLPLDARGHAVLDADISGRPTLMGHKKEITLNESFRGLTENTFLNLKNKSYIITAEVEVSEGFKDGVLITQGGRYGGYGAYIKDGKPLFHYNCVDRYRYTITSDKVVPDGRHQIRYEFTYDGDGAGKGGTMTIYIDNEKVGEGRIDRTMGYLISFDEKINIGEESGTPVFEDMPSNNSSIFKGKLFSINVKILD